MKARYVCLLCVVGALLSGCAHWDRHNKAQFDKYIDRHYSAMYEEYGAPVRVAPMPDGGNFIEFATTSSGYLCTARVQTDRRGIITAIGTGGHNGCITGKY